MRNMPIYIPEGSYFTPAEASDYLGVGYRYVCRLVESGRLTGIRICRNTYLIPEAEVIERKQNPPPVGRPKAGSAR